jgi:predicted ArsR family transcriptional regulator
MHENSLFAWAEEQNRLGERASQILASLHQDGPGTDREICKRLGFTDPNACRPRLTELIKKGLARECGSTRDSVTGKTVRIVESCA